MIADQHFQAVRGYILKQEPTMRLAVTVKLYFAYFLTMDELQRLYQEFGDDYRHPDSDTLYRAALPWFTKYSPFEISNFDDMLNQCRPFVWKLEDLREEFSDLFAEIDTPWITYNDIDYSNGRIIGDSPLHEIEWYEERGMIEVDGMLITRSIQPVMIGERVSEKIVLAMPACTHQEFSAKFELIPGMSGGCAFKAIYGPAQLDINYADNVGIDDVDSVMLCVAKLALNESKEMIMEEFPRFEYFNVKRTLRNGLEVPFIQ